MRADPFYSRDACVSAVFAVERCQAGWLASWMSHAGILS